MAYLGKEPIPIVAGGTGAATLTGVLTGNGTSAITANTITQYGTVIAGASNAVTSVAPSATSGVPLISQGASANPAYGTAVVAGGGTGAVTLTGLLTGNGTSAVTATAITQYNVITGGATNAPNSVAPSATSGVPLISQGASSQPIFGTAVVAGGGTGVATMTTAYAPVCAGTTATGALQVASTGLSTSGYVLTSTGSSSLPSFQALPASGALTLISTQTASNSATVSFTSGITSTYANYLLVFNGVIPVTNGTDLRMVVSTNGGSSYLNSGYLSGYNFVAYNSAAWTNGNASTYFYLLVTQANTAGAGGSGHVFLYDVSTGNTLKINGASTRSDSLYGLLQGNQSSNTFNAIQLAMSSGNISSGTFSLYGLSK